MVDLNYQVFNKNTGEEVMRDCGIFNSVSHLFAYLGLKYGYTECKYTILYHGKEM